MLQGGQEGSSAEPQATTEEKQPAARVRAGGPGPWLQGRWRGAGLGDAWDIRRAYPPHNGEVSPAPPASHHHQQHASVHQTFVKALP